MDFHVTLDGRGDRSTRIYRQLLEAILDGRLRPGERVPPTRELGERLGVARNTVAVAYDRLTAEGFLVGRVGAGTYVYSDGDRPRSRQAPAGADVRPRATWAAAAEPERDTASGLPYDFSAGVPDVGLFPFGTWRRLLRPEAARADYGDPSGLPELREAIARHVGVSRSVRADTDDVLVTQGAQQALDLVCRVLVEPGECVAVEDPGYPLARALFRSHGARVVGVPVDGEGLVVDALPPSARLVYTTPSHQFPLGTPMSLRRRTALLDWARRHGAVVVEDDYDSEFRYSDRPLEPLQSLDRAGRVVYVGSFSKTLLPTLRLGFLVAPASLRPALRAAKQLTDWHGDPIAQAALARFIDEGLLARHIRRATRVYAARHARITAALRDDFARWLEVVPSAAGIHLAARTRCDPDEVVGVARSRGVAIRALSSFSPEVHFGLVIGFGAIPVDRIDDGLRLLAGSFPQS
ncbi:PLP-dependent aminotransferase family protein [Umezawaea tangerina]|uniref:GntR family transcriptional regulator n=1 Tax=Umezawaea tangerina TaxID=84725 RepID=A0A2T0SA96_9PSEU|nr:PLP-dependent aminotransferase family protein [Umezawaea tangerina]PRY30347.1 GntR family transcriptional regulator [Umezawaea tangerina]